MTKAVIYLRKSTDKEDNQVLSLESQREYCVEYAKREGIVVVEIIEESMSASTPGRPGYAKLIGMMGNEGVDTIVTWKLNRLSRNSVDAGSFTWLLQQGIIKRTCTSDGIYTQETNMLLISVLFGMSQQYTIDLKKDITRGQRTAVMKGQLISKAPLGYKNDKNTKKAVMTDEAGLVKKMFELRAEGKTFGEIQKLMGGVGLKLREETVARIVANRFYYGALHFHGEFFKGNHEPLITKELWDKANKEERSTWSKIIGRFPLKGKIKELETGKTLTASISKGGTGQKFLYYHTKEKGGARISEKKIHEKFEEILPMMKIPESKRQEFLSGMIDREKNHMVNSIALIETLQKRKNALQASAEGLFDMRMGKEIDGPTYVAKNTKLHDEISTCDQEIAKIEQGNNDIKEKTIRLFELSESPLDIWKTLSEIGKSQMLSNFLVELKIDKENGLFFTLEDIFAECYDENMRMVVLRSESSNYLDRMYSILSKISLKQLDDWISNVQTIGSTYLAI